MRRAVLVQALVALPARLLDVRDGPAAAPDGDATLYRTSCRGLAAEGASLLAEGALPGKVQVLPTGLRNTRRGASRAAWRQNQWRTRDQRHHPTSKPVVTPCNNRDAWAGRWQVAWSALAGFCAGVVGRERGIGANDWQRRTTKRPTIGSAEQQETGDTAPKGGYTFNMLRTRGNSWARALAANDQSAAGGALTAVGRLLFCHWVQPALYWAVFACFYDQIDGAQWGFGWAVAVREALYLLTTLVALYANPAFLLVDVGASVRDVTAGGVGSSGYGFLALYVLAPEKFVACAAYGNGGLGWMCMMILALLGGALLDLCSVGALIAGLAAGNLLPGALAVGYAATTLDGLLMLGFWAPCAPWRGRAASEPFDRRWIGSHIRLSSTDGCRQ
jgi:hypothetical protein